MVRLRRVNRGISCEFSSNSKISLALSKGLPASVKKCGNEFLSSLLSSLSGHVLETRPGGGHGAAVVLLNWHGHDHNLHKKASPKK